MWWKNTSGQNGGVTYERISTKSDPPERVVGPAAQYQRCVDPTSERKVGAQTIGRAAQLEPITWAEFEHVVRRRFKAVDENREERARDRHSRRLGHVERARTEQGFEDRRVGVIAQ